MSLNLPPLPPVGGETSGRSVVDVLADQHRELLALCDRLPAGDDPRIGDVLGAVLSRHLSAEQQYLYPAVRAAVPGGEDLADRELAEDSELLRALADLRPGGPGAVERAGRVAAAVRRHVAADEEELLPVLTQMVGAEDLIRIGNRIELAGEAAPTRPHPRTPSTPPWNKIVDPVVAVLDKVRDVLTRRTTYAADLDDHRRDR